MNLISTGINRANDYNDLLGDLDHLQVVLETISRLDKAGFSLNYFEPHMISTYVGEDQRLKPFIEVLPGDTSLVRQAKPVDILAALNSREGSLTEWIAQVEATAAQFNQEVENYLDLIMCVFDSLVNQPIERLSGYVIDFRNEHFSEEPQFAKEQLEIFNNQTYDILQAVGLLDGRGEPVEGCRNVLVNHINRLRNIFSAGINSEDRKVITVIPQQTRTEVPHFEWKIIKGSKQDDDYAPILDDPDFVVERGLTVKDTASVTLRSERSEDEERYIREIEEKLERLINSMGRAMVKISNEGKRLRGGEQ